MYCSAQYTQAYVNPKLSRPQHAIEILSSRVSRIFSLRSNRIANSTAVDTKKRSPADRNGGTPLSPILTTSQVEPQIRQTNEYRSGTTVSADIAKVSGKEKPTARIELATYRLQGGCS